MNCRLTRGIGVSILSLLAATSLAAQENPAKRLSSIVGVAVEEYAKAVDDHGKLISKDEFDETYGFLSDAKQPPADRAPSRTWKSPFSAAAVGTWAIVPVGLLRCLVP